MDNIDKEAELVKRLEESLNVDSSTDIGYNSASTDVPVASITSMLDWLHVKYGPCDARLILRKKYREHLLNSK